MTRNPDSTSSRHVLPRRALVRSRRAVTFLGAYLARFLRSNVQVAAEIISPGSGLAPAVVVVPLRSRTPGEIATYMSLINLSPGTMTLAISEDRRHLTVHGMHAGDAEVFRAEMRELEDMMLAAWRPAPSRPGRDRDGRRP